jgi:PKD repeat protein
MAGSNYPPIAVASASVSGGIAPLTVAFSSAGSSDPEGATLSYSWAFGDGTTSATSNPTHAYQASGVYAAQLTVSDGTNSTASSLLTITVGNGGNGLVAAYGFEEGTGSGVTDISGNGNNGSINGASWTTGKFGKALSFNGTSSLITISDAPSLDLTNGMTLEAWVYPTALSPSWSDIIYKDRDNYFLMGSTPSAQAPDVGGMFASSNVYGTTLPLNAWSHLVGTCDGTTIRFYLNGVMVASQAQSGAMTSSTGALSIGGDGTYGQYWTGLIDEVRVYNRALSLTEVQSDMNTPVVGTSGARPLPPPAPGVPRVVSQQ